MLKIYEYENCSTCRKAIQFLERRKVAFQRVPIVDKPPSAAELKRALAGMGGQLRKLFNTSGLQYRELKIGEKLDTMTEEQALKLLSGNGKLVKRPLVLAQGDAWVGFNEAEWKKRLKLS
jgi:arsenate reductase